MFSKKNIREKKIEQLKASKNDPLFQQDLEKIAQDFKDIDNQSW